MPPLMSYDDFLTALCAWREARGEPDSAIRGVIWVIRNRIMDNRWPNTAAEVVIQPFQFSAFSSGDPNSVRFPLPKFKTDWAAWERCLSLVTNPGPDPTLGATNYESCPDESEPSWAMGKAAVARLGAFEFYRL